MKVTGPKFQGAVALTPDAEAPAVDTDAAADAVPEFPAATFSWELVTPQRAKELLDKMHKNRLTSRIESTVHEDNLRDGHFFPAISVVYLDPDGRPWDGKHRLEAILRSGKSTYLGFITGVTAEEARYVDTGRRRTYDDLLAMDGIKDHKRQSAIANAMALYTKYGMDGIRMTGKFKVTQADKAVWVNSDAMVKCLHASDALYRALGGSNTWLAYAVWRTGQTDPETGEFTVDPWWDGVRTGAGLEVGDPALALRTWLLNGAKRGRREASRRLTQLYAMSVSWNKHVTGLAYNKVSIPFDVDPRSGRVYFASSSVVDFFPRDIGPKTASQLQTLFREMRNGK